MSSIFTKWNLIYIGVFVVGSCFLIWLCKKTQRSPASDLGRFGGIILGHLTDHTQTADIGPPIVRCEPIQRESVKRVTVKRKRHKFTKKQRHYLAARQNYQCNYCGIDLGRRLIDCDIDHITPLSQGGKDWGESNGQENLQYLCTYCHRVKTRNE